MNLSNARATIGLQASASPTSSNVSGSVQIGENTKTVSFPDADVAYSVRAIFAAGGDSLAINLTTCDTTGSTAFVAGAAQVETATAAGTITLAGNATVTVTAAGMTGSPKAISVPVALADTPASWAAKARTALAADANVSALFSVSGANAAIILTRKPTSSHNVPGGALNLHPGNDSLINIALANGTCTGITPAATSANTITGVLSEGVKIYDGDGKDFEGNTISAITDIRGVAIGCGVNSVDQVLVSIATASIAIPPGGSFLMTASLFAIGFNEAGTIIADGGMSDITITVIGKAA